MSDNLPEQRSDDQVTRRRRVSSAVDSGEKHGSDILSPEETERLKKKESQIKEGERFSHPEQEFEQWPQILKAVTDEFISLTTGAGALSVEEIRSDAKYNEMVSSVLQRPQFVGSLRPVDTERLVALLRAYQFGYGALEDYMRLPRLEEIIFNRFDQGFYIIAGHKQKINQQIFADSGAMIDFIRRIAIANDLEFNLQKANIDATLKDGSRLNATLPPLAVDGPDLVIRKHHKQGFSLQEMIENNVLTKELATDLRNWIHGGVNIVVSGGTSSGKTTFLNTLGNSFIPKEDRLLVLENRKELQIATEDTKYFQTREDALREGGENDVTMKDLIRFCLRKRPDRIIVGEVRGSEAFHALTAWNSGHDGSLCTVHANSAQGALSKLEQLCGYASELDPSAVRSLIADAVDIIIQVTRYRGREERRVVEVLQVLHQYKADNLSLEVNQRVTDLIREEKIRQLPNGIWVFPLYRQNSSGQLEKQNNLIPIEGKSAR